MEWQWAGGVLVAAITALGTIFVARQTRNTTREIESAKLQAEYNATILLTSTGLVKDLQAERDAWKVERAEYLARIKQLEAAERRRKRQGK